MVEIISMRDAALDVFKRERIAVLHEEPELVFNCPVGFGFHCNRDAFFLCHVASNLMRHAERCLRSRIEFRAAIGPPL